MSYKDAKEFRDDYRRRHGSQDEPHEHPDGTFHVEPVFNIPDDNFGLILETPEEKLERSLTIPFEALELVTPPDPLPVDPLFTGYQGIPASTLIDGHTKGYWTSQTGGTCGGFGSAEGQDDDFSNPGDPAIFDGMDRYYSIREGNVPASEVKNINAGVQSGWVKTALVDPKKGGSRRGVGKWLSRDPRYLASSCWWMSTWQEIETVIYNSWLRYTGQLATLRMGVDIGIPIYAAFLSPKKIAQADGSTIFAVYWQDSWGAFKGGHWMRIAGFSKKIKVRAGSAGSVFLPGTWADQGFPEAWMAVEDLIKAVNMQGDILAIMSKDVGPAPAVGKLELVSFSINPPAPVVGDVVDFNLVAKNTGSAPLVGAQLGIEEAHDADFPPGYRGPLVDVAVGATVEYNPVGTPITKGHWVWKGDVLKPAYQVLQTIEVDVADRPTPPPPPPADHVTVDITIHAPDGDYIKAGVEVPKAA